MIGEVFTLILSCTMTLVVPTLGCSNSAAGDGTDTELGLSTDTETGTEEGSETSSDTEGATETGELPPLATCGYTGSGPYIIPPPGEGDGYCADVEPNNNPNEAVQCGHSDFSFYS